MTQFCNISNIITNIITNLLFVFHKDLRDFAKKIETDDDIMPQTKEAIAHAQAEPEKLMVSKVF